MTEDKYANYKKMWQQEPRLPEEPHPCFCVGPKPGYADCPCVERQKMNAKIDTAIAAGRSPWDRING